MVHLHYTVAIEMSVHLTLTKTLKESESHLSEDVSVVCGETDNIKLTMDIVELVSPAH